MKKSVWIAAAVAVAIMGSVHAETSETLDRPTSWTAPPFWTPPAPAASVRTAEGRTALVPLPAALPFIALPPCRVIDTRGNGAPLTGGFLPAATVRSYTVTGVCGIPANAQALSLNATVVLPTGPGFLVLYPQGGTFPPVSTLNFLGNDVIVNAAVVPISGAGGISMALGVSGGDVILDVNGYYAPVASVTSLNALTGDLTLTAGSNVSITPGAGSLTVAANVTLGGDVTGAPGANVVAAVGGSTAANVHAAELAANAATSANTANTIVKRDGAGSINAQVVSASGGFKQPGTGGETLRTVRGFFIGSSGAPYSGTGFTVSRASAGVYTLTFQTCFSTYPSVVVSLINDTAGIATAGLGAGYSQCAVPIHTFTTAGVAADFQYVNFIATGPN
jgi:hypothetical protein